jgi:hypothetical protein
VVDGIVGPLTWAALPDGRSMPTLQEGSTGNVVHGLQQVLTNGAPGQWNIADRKSGIERQNVRQQHGGQPLAVSLR